LADECLDWERFILMGFLSEGVAEKVSQLYMETSKKRYEYLLQCIDQTLKSGEAGIVFIREGNWLQFPSDIEVFSVTPPVLDESIAGYEKKRREERNIVKKIPNDDVYIIYMIPCIF